MSAPDAPGTMTDTPPGTPGTTPRAATTCGNPSCQSLQAEVERLGKERKLFPIMSGPALPWSVIEPHERQAQQNHSQSLTRLAERGGLSPCEAVAVLEDRDWHRMDAADAKRRLQKIVDASLRPKLEAAEAALAELRDQVMQLCAALKKADDYIQSGLACRSEAEFTRWMHDSYGQRPTAEMIAERPRT